jgi:hypothetical protein
MLRKPAAGFSLPRPILRFASSVLEERDRDEYLNVAAGLAVLPALAL